MNAMIKLQCHKGAPANLHAYLQNMFSSRVGMLEEYTHVQKPSAALLAVFTAHGHAKAVLSVDSAQRGRRLVTGSKDRTCKVWDVTKACEVTSYGAHPNNVVCVRTLGEHCVLTASMGSVRLFDTRVDGNICVQTYRYISGGRHLSHMQHYACSSSGMCHDVGGAAPWPCNARQATLPERESAVTDVRVKNGTYMLVAAGNTVRVWDLRRLVCCAQFFCFVFVTNNSLLVTYHILSISS
jgi:WD40 repeat protein